MLRYDRLSSLISRFQLSVSVAEPGTGNLRVLGRRTDGEPVRIELRPRAPGTAPPTDGEAVLVEARVDWGGGGNPLMGALPSALSLPLAQDGEAGLVVRVLLAEARAGRCGSGTVLSRLAEVLVIRLLRLQIERGDTGPGLLAGLACPRISRVLVAIHEDPGRDWRNADLATIAGLSLSRFADLFGETVGRTPNAYLRQWRMTLARQDIGRGHRVQAVARRYGYASTEALSRSFRRQFGVSPTDLRREPAAAGPGAGVN